MPTTWQARSKKTERAFYKTGLRAGFLCLALRIYNATLPSQPNACRPLIQPALWLSAGPLYGKAAKAFYR